MPDISLNGLSAQQLRTAAAVRDRIDRLTAQLARILGGTPSPRIGATATRKPKRKMSPEARAKIAAAQRRRWARQKAAAKATR